MAIVINSVTEYPYGTAPILTGGSTPRKKVQLNFTLDGGTGNIQVWVDGALQSTGAYNAVHYTPNLSVAAHIIVIKQFDNTNTTIVATSADFNLTRTAPAAASTESGTTAVDDTFTDGAYVALDLHTGETGATWAKTAQTLLPTSFGNSGAISNYRVESTLLTQENSATTNAVVFPSGNPTETYYFYDFHLDKTGTGLTTRFRFVIAHRNSGGLTSYIDVEAYHNSTALSFNINVRSGGSTYSTTGITNYANGAHTLRFEARNTYFRLLMDGTEFFNSKDMLMGAAPGALADGTVLQPTSAENLLILLSSSSTSFQSTRISRIRAGGLIGDPITVKGSWEAKYNIIGAAIAQQWGVTSQLYILSELDRPRGSFDALFRYMVQAEWDASYSLIPRLLQTFDATYRVGGVITGEWDAKYHLFTAVQADHDLKWLMNHLRQSWDATSRLADTIVAVQDIPSGMYNALTKAWEQSHALLTNNPVRAEWSAGFSYVPDSQVVALTQPIITVGGIQVEVLDATLSNDEGSPVWEASISLSDALDIRLFPANTQFTLNYNGEEFVLIVDSRSANRPAPGEANASISGRSPIVKYMLPRAAPIDKTWGGVLASSVAQELIPGISWEIIDWVLPHGVFGVERSTPYEAVRKLAEAAGGVVDSAPNGDIRVRYLHLVSVPFYGAATKNLTASDATDNFSVEERNEAVKVVNLITISNSDDQNQADRLEFVNDEVDAEKGILRIYPGVWRDNVTVRSTHSGVKYTRRGTQKREEKETVEFVQGKSSTRFPVTAITSTTWRTANLGAISVDSYSTELRSSAGDGYGVADIVYETACHEWDVTGPLGQSAQFISGE